MPEQDPNVQALLRWILQGSNVTRHERRQLDDRTQSTTAFARNESKAKPGPYQTRLSPQEEFQFQLFVLKNNINFDTTNPFPDYDMRGWFRGYQSQHPKATVKNEGGKLYFPDYWKTPYHQEFNRESLYAKPDADWSKTQTEEGP